MTRLIDLDEAIAAIKADKIHIDSGLLAVGADKAVYDAINNACDRHVRMLEGLEVQEERKHGKWKHVDISFESETDGTLKGWMPWYCSECGCGVGKHQTTFCPNSGADMRGEKDDSNKNIT